MTLQPLDALIEEHHLDLAARAYQQTPRAPASLLDRDDWCLVDSLLLRTWAHCLRGFAPVAAGPQAAPSQSSAVAGACGVFFARDGAAVGSLVEHIASLRAAVRELLLEAPAERAVPAAIVRFDAVVDVSIASAVRAYVGEVERERKQRLRRLAHDLRSQLNVVALAAEALMGQPAGSDIPPYAEKIQRGSGRLRMLLDDLHGITHTTGSRPVPAVNNVASACREMARNLRADEGFRIEWTAPLVVCGRFDSSLVCEALSNLIRLLAAPAHADRAVSVETTHAGSTVAWSVRGVDAQAASPADPDAPPDSGHDVFLRLMAARQVARRHGGAVWKSEPGEAPWYRMELPAEPAS